jgi:hypothetical protein
MRLLLDTRLVPSLLSFATRSDLGYTQTMIAGDEGFGQSVRRQIAVNRARSASGRIIALCELLDAARAMAPSEPSARERRLRAQVTRKLDREKWRAECRRLLAAQWSDAPAGV